MVVQRVTNVLSHFQLYSSDTRNVPYVQMQHTKESWGFVRVEHGNILWSPNFYP